jgi:putative flippase GtrA
MDVVVAMALAAITAIIASYSWMGVLTFRAAGNEQGSERKRRYMRVHALILGGAALVLATAHPWGPATMALGCGVVVGCHVLYIQAIIIGGLILQRRAGRTQRS